MFPVLVERPTVAETGNWSQLLPLLLAICVTLIRKVLKISELQFPNLKKKVCITKHMVSAKNYVHNGGKSLNQHHRQPASLAHPLLLASVRCTRERKTN